MYDKVLLHATEKSRFCQNYGGTAKTGLFFGGIVEKNTAVNTDENNAVVLDKENTEEIVEKNNADFVDNTAKIRYNVGEQK